VIRTRTYVFLAALCLLASAVQIVAVQWGLLSLLFGGLLSGLILLAGIRLLALEIDVLYLSPLVAACASLLGLAVGLAGADVKFPAAAWSAPLLAAFPTGTMALRTGLRAQRCQLCGTPLRRLLYFSCPRCQLVACENCWQFERGRCRLCEANLIRLFPLDISWWQEQFGSQLQTGRCALCLRPTDGQTAHWACVDCGHGQCRSCWDDNNGQCSRCGWTIPDLPAELSAFVAVGQRKEKFQQ
jgi:hypothetical protein